MEVGGRTKWLSWAASAPGMSSLPSALWPTLGKQITQGLACLWPIIAAVLFLQADFSLSLLSLVCSGS